MTGHVIYDWRGDDTLVAFSGSLANIRDAASNPFEDVLLPGVRYRIVKIVGPYEIGPWWRTRFRQLPQGFRFDVTYAAE